MKKQLSELRGFFKGKDENLWKGKLKLLEDLEKASAQEYGADRKT